MADAARITITPPSEKLSRRTKAAYAIGDLGNSAGPGTIVPFWYLYFLTDIAKLDPALLGHEVLTDDAPITVKTRTLLIPVSNRFLRLLQRLRIIKRQEFDGHVQSEVWTMRIGQGQFVTLPGQAFYDVGLKLKEQMEGPYKFIIGQGNDEISYIVPPWRWEKEEGYEEGVSLGPESWPTIEAAIPW